MAWNISQWHHHMENSSVIKSLITGALSSAVDSESCLCIYTIRDYSECWGLPHLWRSVRRLTGRNSSVLEKEHWESSEEWRVSVWLLPLRSRPKSHQRSLQIQLIQNTEISILLFKNLDFISHHVHILLNITPSTNSLEWDLRNVVIEKSRSAGTDNMINNNNKHSMGKSFLLHCINVLSLISVLPC